MSMSAYKYDLYSFRQGCKVPKLKSFILYPLNLFLDMLTVCFIILVNLHKMYVTSLSSWYTVYIRLHVLCAVPGVLIFGGVQALHSCLDDIQRRVS